MENRIILENRGIRSICFGLLIGTAIGALFSALVIILTYHYGRSESQIGNLLMRPYLATVWLSEQFCRLTGQIWPLRGRVLSVPSMTLIFLTNGLATGLLGSVVGFLIRLQKNHDINE